VLDGLTVALGGKVRNLVWHVQHAQACIAPAHWLHEIRQRLHSGVVVLGNDESLKSMDKRAQHQRIGLHEIRQPLHSGVFLGSDESLNGMDKHAQHQCIGFIGKDSVCTLEWSLGAMKV